MSEKTNQVLNNQNNQILNNSDYHDYHRNLFQKIWSRLYFRTILEIAALIASFSICIVTTICFFQTFSQQYISSNFTEVCYWVI